MKKIKLSNGKYTLVSNQDYDWLNQFKWNCSKTDYVCRRPRAYESDYGRNKKIYMARFILGLKAGEGHLLEGDHINGNTLDNQRENLRIVNPTQNKWNRRVQKNSVRGYKNIKIEEYHGVKGTYLHYQVVIRTEGKKFHKNCKTLEQAILLRNQKLKEYNGEFAKHEYLGS